VFHLSEFWPVPLAWRSRTGNAPAGSLIHKSRERHQGAVWRTADERHDVGHNPYFARSKPTIVGSMRGTYYQIQVAKEPCQSLAHVDLLKGREYVSVGINKRGGNYLIHREPRPDGARGEITGSWPERR
jgi:hypothetical protein